MKIELLSVAMSDIQMGQRFYEQQQGGLGVFVLVLRTASLHAVNLVRTLSRV